MGQKTFRPLTDTEKGALYKMISVVSSAGEILKKQIESSIVKEIDDLGSLEFSVSTNEKYSDVTGPFITAQQKDVDTVPMVGPYINFLLFLREGTICELEVYKDDGSQIMSACDPDKFILTWGLPPKKRSSREV